MHPLASGVVLTALTALATAAPAATVTLQGDTVDFLFDTSQPALSLLGSPTVEGDTLDFLPAGFEISTSGAGGEVVTLSQSLEVTVRAREGLSLDAGAFTLTGLHSEAVFDPDVPGGARAETGLSLAGTINGTPVLEESRVLGERSTEGGPSLQPWAFGLADQLGGQSLDMRLDVLLYGFSTDLAFAEVRVTDMALTVTAVPLPPAAWLLGSAVVSLIALGRRRAGTDAAA